MVDIVNQLYKPLLSAHLKGVPGSVTGSLRLQPALIRELHPVKKGAPYFRKPAVLFFTVS